MNTAVNQRSHPILSRVPNGLSWFRICAVPVTMWLAWQKLETQYIVLFAIAMLTDFLDGYIARKYELTSRYGAVLDSLADLVTYFSLPICLWWLWPEMINTEWAWIALGMGCYLLPIFISFIKFRKFPSFHTWSAKVGAVCSLPVLILWIAYDLPVALYIFVCFQVWVALEQVLLIGLLKEWSCNIPSVFTVIRASKLESPSAEPEQARESE